MTEKANGLSAYVNDLLIKKYASVVPISYELLDNSRSANGRKVLIATAEEQRAEYDKKVAEWNTRRKELDDLEYYMEERNWLMRDGGYEYEPAEVLPLRDWTKWVFDDEKS